MLFANFWWNKNWLSYNINVFSLFWYTIYQIYQRSLSINDIAAVFNQTDFIFNNILRYKLTVP